jgi:sulfonate transport system substrate-binding protein
MKSKFRRSLAILVAATVSSAFMVSSANAAPKKDQYQLLLGSTPHFAAPVSAILKGLCKPLGLNVEIKKFTSGGVAAQSFMAGKGDFVDTGDWPAVRTWLKTADQDDPIVGLAPDAFYGDLEVIQAKASITDPQQLKGKKIGVWLGTTSEFWTALYLDAQGIGLDEVELINIKPAEMVIALDRGDIDAFGIWQPFGWKSDAVSGDKVHALSDAKGYFTEYIVVSTRKSLLDNDPDAAKAMVQCMQKGADFLRNNIDEAGEILAKFFKLPLPDTMRLIKVLNNNVAFTPAFRKDMDSLNNFMMGKGKSKMKINWDVHFDSRGVRSVDPALVQ